MNAEPLKYMYTVITRENATACDLSPRFWENHPDWQFVVRTNVRHPDRPGVWLSGGGVTLEEAIESAEFAIRHCQPPTVRMTNGVTIVGPPLVAGEESPTVIRNRP